jgi:hypothetical protein
MWMGMAFGVGVVMLIALTVAIAAGIGELANGSRRTRSRRREPG